MQSLVFKLDWALALVSAGSVILLGAFLGAHNNGGIITNPAPFVHYTSEPSNPLSFLSNWDGPDYLRIAHTGYVALRDTNFFPVYPLLVHILSLVIPSALDSALIVSWLSLVGATYFYIKLLKLLFPDTDTKEIVRGLPFLLFYPTGVFLIATYTEGLSLFLSLGATYFALRKKYLRAALFALVCSATHITGLFVVLLVVMILVEEKERISRIVLAGIVGSLGLLSYMGFLYAKFKQPFSFVTSQKAHGWLEYGYAHMFATMNIFDSFFIVCIFLTAIYWWHRRKSFAVYALLFLLIPVIGKQFGGYNRYMLVAFPLMFAAYGYLRGKKLSYSMAIILLGVCWAYFLFQYAAGFIGG